MCTAYNESSNWLFFCFFFTEGFDCRCGNLFCAIHRYSDKHDCPYDYRSAAAARIRKENPIVVAEKIQKLWGLSAKKKVSLTLWIWTLVTWMKTPDIMASFVHDSLTWVGWGAWCGCSHCPDASLTSISLSLHYWLWLNLSVFCVCICMKVCAHMCESLGGEL